MTTRFLLPGILLVALLGSESLAQGCCGPIQGSDSPGIAGGLAQSQAQATPQAPAKLKLDEVGTILDELIESSFPELKGIRYVLYRFKSKTIRFRSNFRLPSLFFGKRVYRIGVNRSVLNDPPPPLALRAVLAHELAHTLYYHQRSRGQVLKVTKIFFNKDAQIDFELATDLEAARRGFAPGLAAYRNWVQPRLPKDKSAGYGSKYYEAEDFALIGRIAKTRPDVLLAWQSDPPRNAEELRAHWAAALRTP